MDLLLVNLNHKVEQGEGRQRQSHDAHSAVREFRVNEAVYARNNITGPHWLPGQVTELQGSAMCNAQLGDIRTIVHHFDQLHPRRDIKLIVNASDSANQDDEPPIQTDTRRSNLVQNDSGEQSEIEHSATDAFCLVMRM